MNDSHHEFAKATKRDTPLAVGLHWTCLGPRTGPGTVVDLLRLAIGEQQQDDKMLWLASETHGLGLSSLHLNKAPIRRPGIMTLRRSRKKVQTVARGGEDFADAADNVAVKSEVPSREQRLELTDDGVEFLNQSGNLESGMICRSGHVMPWVRQ